MANTMPAVSVMMTVYNAERYVAAAVESVLGQTLRDFELIVIDDGSRDRSGEILRTLAARDGRIRLVCRPNTGVSRARNEALALARAQFVAIMDADDVALPQRLRDQVDFLLANPDVLCVGSWFEALDEKGRLLRRYQTPTAHDEIVAMLLKGHAAICQPSTMLRVAAVREVGGFDETLPSAEDLDLHLKLSERGRMANIPAYLVRYRLHEGSISSTGRTEMYAAARAVCARAWARRGIGGQFEPLAPHRPDQSRAARFDWNAKCGWWAYNSGERRTAFLYGLKSVAISPLRGEGWRLLACSALRAKRQADAEGNP